jgi:hypothetical protein
MSDVYDEKFEEENVTPIHHQHRWQTQQVCKDCQVIRVVEDFGPFPEEWAND